MRGGDLRELAIEAADLGLEFVDFLDHQRQRVPDHVGKIGRGVVKNGRHPSEHCRRADRARDPRRLPLRAHAMHGLQRLLFDCVQGHRANLAAARRFQQGVLSARSVLLRRTYGRTYCGGSSRTPRA